MTSEIVQENHSRKQSEGKDHQKLIPRLRAILKRMHYSIHTENSYVNWVVRFIRFHHTRHPRELGKEHIEAFLIVSRLIY